MGQQFDKAYIVFFFPPLSLFPAYTIQFHVNSLEFLKHNF